MGILKLILGFDKRDYEELKEKAENLEQENKLLLDKIRGLEEYVSKLEKELLAVRRVLNELIEDVEDLKNRVEDIERSEEQEEAEEQLGDEYPGQAGAVEDNSVEDIEAVVLEYISKGVTTPTELVEKTGLSKHKLYDILKSLSDKGILTKKREGRRVHYIPAVSSEIQV